KKTDNHSESKPEKNIACFSLGQKDLENFIAVILNRPISNLSMALSLGSGRGGSNRILEFLSTPKGIVSNITSALKISVSVYTQISFFSKTILFTIVFNSTGQLTLRF